MIVLALACSHCSVAPLRGPDYGAGADPFRSPDLEAGPPPRAAPAHRLILIGDAGSPQPDDLTLAALGRWGDAHPDRTTVLYLGDNVYPAGLRDETREHGEAVLRQLLGASRARKIFLPGNHDWGTLETALHEPTVVRAQEEFVESAADADATFMPDAGCPGPEARTLATRDDGLPRDLTVIAVDFHWWLLPEAQRPVCQGVEGTDGFLELLTDELERHRDDYLVVAAHHPLRSGGPHGGLTRGFLVDVGVRVYPWLRGTLQDLWEPGYAEMIRIVSEALTPHRPLVFAAGHEHSLQVLAGGDAAALEIVSGAGSSDRITPVTHIEGTLFAHGHTGFVVLDFFGEVAGEDLAVLQVVEPGHEAPVFRTRVELPAPAAPPEEAGG